MWPDVATKVWKIFYEKDEDKKTEIKEQATKVTVVLGLVAFIE